MENAILILGWFILAALPFIAWIVFWEPSMPSLPVFKRATLGDGPYTRTPEINVFYELGRIAPAPMRVPEEMFWASPVREISVLPMLAPEMRRALESRRVVAKRRIFIVGADAGCHIER